MNRIAAGLMMTGDDDLGSRKVSLIGSETDSSSIGELPDHILIDIFTRIPATDWSKISCVKKQWANLFKEECFWQAAIFRNFPMARNTKGWPGPIPRGISRRRYTALYVCKHMMLFSLNDDDDEDEELIGHTYLFLKEQLEVSSSSSLSSIMSPSPGILHGTMIDQFIACGKSRDKANDLASQIWLHVIENLEENEQTFLLLKGLALEANVFLPYPYSRSIKVQRRVFEKLFTDFRDCFNDEDYYDVLACAKHKFQPIPSSWLGY
ncbi:uncharacterized protein LOC124915095 [Impatiens glandulifera]|uniref:uncharacterized protein LOC124915095 n=1 Tax=Impatiens glandulifera TaxID=253017 RepID=UPI001FB14CAD|nr:uncharacterized protein LOC124915095 [Impatiens glandulifera]